MNEVTMKPGKYSLKRLEDGRGNSGNVLEPGDTDEEYDNGTIRVGQSVVVMSLSSRGRWTTSIVKEITKVNEDKTEVEFKTANSTYIAKSF